MMNGLALFSTYSHIGWSSNWVFNEIVLRDDSF